MDNVCRVTPDVDIIKKDIKENELVSAIGEFHYKDYIISSQDVKEKLISKNSKQVQE